MTIYVDDLRKYDNTKVSHISLYWCHMTSDNSLCELHEFAASIGLERSWFENHKTIPHYDLTPNKRELAIKYGAIELSCREFILKLRNLKIQ